MKRYGRVFFLATCILVCAISVFGHKEAEISAKMDNSDKEDGQIDDMHESDNGIHMLVYQEPAEETMYEGGNANPQGNRIAYEDGYYYYASQLDNYFLYRVKEDGSEAECLAKVHPGTILVDGDAIYFVNLSDNKSIYRIGTDGSDMQKICDNSDDHIEMSAEYLYFLDDDDVLYRIRKDGSDKELLLKDADNYTIAASNGGKVMYDGYLYRGIERRNKETEQWETVVMRYDLDGKNEEEICCFNFDGNIMVLGDRIYCHTIYGRDAGKTGVYTAWKKEMQYPSNEGLTDYCIYKGVLYGIREDKTENGRSTKVYELKYGETQWKEIYCNDVDYIVSNEKSLADIYATEQGIFFRQFVSPEEGVKWFSLGEGGNVEKFEDEKETPITKPAFMMEYQHDGSGVKSEFKSTYGYEAYLREDLTYEEFYRKNEEGEGFNSYTIRLPQFNEKIEGYQEINAYVRDAYQDALGYKEEFFDMLNEEKERLKEDFPNPMLYEGTDYDYVYIGEKYITIAKYQYGYRGGVRSWYLEEPVTFERKTGRVVFLEEFFGNSPEEAVARATASIYKYMENGDSEGIKIFLKDEDILTEKFIPEQFFLFPEGVGLYYGRNAIDSTAAGDYLFVVPYSEYYCDSVSGMI